MTPLERLERLVYVLEHRKELPLLPMGEDIYGELKGPPHRFDLRTWAQCGTTACAIGYGACDPVLREEGLRLVPRYGRDFMPVFQGHDNMQAVMACFGLEYPEACHLFLDVFYASSNHKPSSVVRRIKAFIKRKQEESNT